MESNDRALGGSSDMSGENQPSGGPHPVGGEVGQDGLSVIDDQNIEWVWLYRTLTPEREVPTYEYVDITSERGPFLPANKPVTVFYVAAANGPDGSAELWGTTRLGWRFLMSDLLRTD